MEYYLRQQSDRSQKSLLDNFKSTIDSILSRGETLVQLSQTVSDLLELEHFVELPALTKSLSIHAEGMSAGT